MTTRGTTTPKVALRDLARIAWRESRHTRTSTAVFIACIALGVAAIVVVAGVSGAVQSGVVKEGRTLMAGDVLVQAYRPPPAELDSIIHSFDLPVQRMDILECVSVVVGPDGTTSTLAQLKAVPAGKPGESGGPGEPVYPWYGRLALEPDVPLEKLIGHDDALVVAPELLDRLHAKVGDHLMLGGQSFRIAGVVNKEPDKLAISFSMGPRIFLTRQALARTSLAGPGARVNHRTLLKLPDQADAVTALRLKRWILARLPDATYYHVQTFTQVNDGLRRGFEHIGQYLGLMGLLTLLIGALGVAQVGRVWVARQSNDLAILRCLGLRPREVMMIFIGQMFGLSLVASVVGALIGLLLLILAPRIAPGLTHEILPAELMNPWQFAAMGRGLVMGLLVSAVAVLPGLTVLQNLPPVRVLRKDVEPAALSWQGKAAVTGVILAAVWLAAWVQAGSWAHGGWFTGGLVITLGALWVGAAGLSAVARWCHHPSRDGHLSFYLRHGLSHLARPGTATLFAIVALGLGVSCLFAAWQVEHRLSSELEMELPSTAPTTFLVDIQPDQWASLHTLLLKLGATDIITRPIINARFQSINGRLVSDIIAQDRASEIKRENTQAGRGENPGGSAQEDRRDQHWALTREQHLSYGPTLPAGNEVIEGRFEAHAREPGVSVEKDFARDLGVKVGSSITFNVQGVMTTLKVTSLRTVDWRNFGLNFFVFLEPGPLDDAPQMRVASLKLPEDQANDAQTQVVKAFANVTVIDLRDVIHKVLVVLNRLGLAVRGLGLFTLAAGMVVMGAAAAAAQSQRAREAALFKTLGMTRKDVVVIFAIQYALVGMAAGITGVLAGMALAWAVAVKLMELTWHWPWMAALAGLVLTILLSIAAGLLASLPALRQRPIEVFRYE